MGTGPKLLSLPACLLFCFCGLALSQEPSATEEVASSPQPAQVEYTTPYIEGQYLYEHFDDAGHFASKWVKSAANKDDASELKYDGEWTRIETQIPLKGMLPVGDRRSLIH